MARTPTEARTTVEVAPLREKLLRRIRLEFQGWVYVEYAPAVAERYGIPLPTARRTVENVLYGRYGRMSVWWADRLACALDMHLDDVYGLDWHEFEDDARDDLSVV